MKKTLIIVAAIIVTIGIVVSLAFLLVPKTIYATDINILTNKIVLQVDEDYYLTDQSYMIEPATYTERPVFTCSDETIASVDIFSGKINAYKIGSCNIVITVKTSENQTINKKILVEVIEKKLYPTWVYINVSSLELYVNQSVVLNTNLIGTTNVLPTVSSANNCVVYDFLTDTITAVKTGTEKLVLNYTLADGSTKSFSIDIVVKDKQVYTSSIIIDISTQNYVFLEYFTESSKADCIIQITNGSDVIQIVSHEYKHIAIKPLKQGTCTVVVDSPTSTCTFYITVI